MIESHRRAYPKLRFTHVVIIATLLGAFSLTCWFVVAYLPEKRAAERQGRKLQLHRFGSVYHAYYGVNGNSPSNVEALESFTPERLLSINPSEQYDASEAYRMVRAGQLVVFWNAVFFDDGEKNDRCVLAYERDAPENGGLVLTGGGAVRQVTADQFKALPRIKVDELLPTPHTP